ncbi:MAG: YceI family protein [bacterium]
MKVRLLAKITGMVLAGTMALTHAAEYEIDVSGKHAFIQFKVSHLGYSFVLGDFPDFGGSFIYDADDPTASSVKVDIDTTTVDTRHAKRNVHVRGGDFLDVKNHPTAAFVSTSYEENGGGEGKLNGDLTLHGVTRPITIEIKKIGEGKDPWGGYRAGFEGNTTITMADFGMTFNLGPASQTADIYFSIEGIRR